jgi:hypothetical protein
MDRPPLPFQLQNPDRLRRELGRAGLKDVRVATVTEKLEFQSGQHLWDWLTNSNPIPELVLRQLSLTSDERGAIKDALERMVRERAGGNGAAVLTNQIHIGIGTK